MGQPAGHISVLAREVCDALASCLPEVGQPPAGVFVDATCGLGGHTLSILERFAPELGIVFDRDPRALEVARQRLADAPCPLAFVQAPFSSMAPELASRGIESVAAIIADLGVSSMQLDTPERGFSFRSDAPLDMRMDPSSGPTAADVLASIDPGSLTRILREYGEEPDAARIAKAIVAARPTTTAELAEVVSAAMSAPQRRKLGKRIHPATRTFQALRIHVNAELEEIDGLLQDGPGLLVVGGRMAIITFHSLEDRRVKRRFSQLSAAPRPPAGVPMTEAELPRPAFAIPRAYARGVTASSEEIDRNPRARSARLRVLERLSLEHP